MNGLTRFLMNLEPDRYCPHCGAVGYPKRKARGSFGVELALWLCFLLPGIIYSVWRGTTKYLACPECGSPGVIPLDSPRAREALRGTRWDQPAS